MKKIYTLGFIIAATAIFNPIGLKMAVVERLYDADTFDTADSYKSLQAVYGHDKANYYTTIVAVVAKRLQIPSVWLEAVIWKESRFDVKARNGNAVGLIQFTPIVYNNWNKFDKNIPVLKKEQILNMCFEEQMHMVEKYYIKMFKDYGKPKSLVDLKILTLSPAKLRSNVIFDSGTIAYSKNSGLDEDGDGVVSRSDILIHMKRRVPFWD